MSRPNLLAPVGKLMVVDKQARLRPFSEIITPQQAQIVTHFEDQLEANKMTRVIILKARQMGMSTVVEGLMFTLALAMERMRGLVLSHETDSAKHLLSMTRNYWETFWAKDLFTAKNLAQNHISWTETGSSVRVATAGNQHTGRSTTIQFLHGSEVGFWANPNELMKGLGQALPATPRSFAVIESTANGRGNWFYQQWHAAVANDSDYTPFFFPWWTYPDYTAEKIGRGDLSLTSLDSEERALYGYLKTQHVTDIESRLLWRRYALSDLCGGDLLALHQEYPAHPEEAFVATGSNAFPAENLTNCYSPETGDVGFLSRAGSRVEWTEDPDGPLKIFRPPATDKAWGQYVVFGDPARTTKTNSDYAVIQVLNRRTWEQVAVWRAKCEPVEFADRLLELALFYNDALLNCEVTGPGYGTMGALTAYNYPHLWKSQNFKQYTRYGGATYGWESNVQTKHAYISFLKKAFSDGNITIHDRVTYAELVDYVVRDNGFGPADEEKGNDDCVTSLAGALITTITTAVELEPHHSPSPLDRPVNPPPPKPLDNPDGAFGREDTSPADYPQKTLNNQPLIMPEEGYE